MKNCPAGLTGLHILVVEDETMIAMMLEDMLQDLGCSVEFAPSVEQALAAIRTHVLHGVLLDMNMHGQTTIAVAEELVGRSMPFLLVTGYGVCASDPPVIKAAPRLLKPFSEGDLAQRMTEVFAQA
jgi:CheY-like chemotaxis protein